MTSGMMTLLRTAGAAVALTLAVGCTAGARRTSMPGARGSTAVPIILDTDIGTDVDDAGALAMLHALESRGEARILAVVSCNRSRWSAPAIDVINTYYGRPEIPIGATRTGPDDEIWYHDAVPTFAHDLTSSSDAPDAIALYRRILAGQPDKSVTIVAIGWLTTIAGLLNSGPDNHSPLAGKDLVAAKVKELVAMGGVWPNTQGQGDYNFMMDRPASRDVIKNWPGTIMFTGLGIDVMTGARLMADGARDNPVRTFYSSFLEANKITERSSWDQIAVLYAVRGLSEYFTAITDGRCVVQEDGSTAWLPASSGKDHGYLVYKMPQTQLATIIEDLMVMLRGARAGDASAGRPAPLAG
jgi:inosine-uridine nucleoside N-ribohydrolase